jgi:hypothetical protein
MEREEAATCSKEVRILLDVPSVNLLNGACTQDFIDPFHVVGGTWIIAG